MLDLAQAIAALAAAAKERQVARADLVAATERVASAIIEPLRSEDSVVLWRTGDGEWRTVLPGQFLSGIRSAVVSVERVTWPIADRRTPGTTAAHRHGTNALVIGDAVLTDPREDRHDPRIGRHSNLGTWRAPWDLHIATGEERMRFADMAPAVVAAFRDLVARQAADYRSGADAITRVAERAEHDASRSAEAT